MFVAIFDTPRAEYRAYGNTKSEALKVLKSRFKLGRCYHDAAYLKEYWCDVDVVEVKAGTFHVDDGK